MTNDARSTENPQDDKTEVVSSLHAAYPKTIRPQLLAILAVSIMAMVLRPAATAIGPVLEELQNDLGVSDTIAGVLTALPGFSFAIVGLVANRLPPKFGLVGSLIGAAALISVGSIFRVLTDSWVPFLIFTFCALAGMAIGNVLVPAFIKSSFPNSSARMATVYTTFLALGTMLPTFFSTSLVSAGSGFLGAEKSWRLAVGIWSIIGIAALGLWIAVKFKCTLPTSSTTTTHKVIPIKKLFKSPTAVALAVFFGTQSMQAYIQFGWAAQAYRAGGLDAATASMMITLISAGGIPGGIIMPRIVARGKGLRTSIVIFSVLLVIGYLGIAFFPTTLPWLWALALSISGFCFPTALAMIIERTRSPQVTGAVAGFAQPIGYILAAFGPFLVGFIFEFVGDWQPILVGLSITSIVMLVSGLYASRPRIIDDEIAA